MLMILFGLFQECLGQDQERNGLNFIRSKCGILVVVNLDSIHFTTELTGQDLQSTEDQNLIIDNVLINVLSTTKSQIGTSVAGLDGQDLLMAHMRWESKYLADQKRIDYLQPDVINLKLSGDRQGMIWVFDTQSKIELYGQKISKIIYATAVVHGIIFVLNSPVIAGNSIGYQISKLSKFLDHIQESQQYLDVKLISQHMKEQTMVQRQCEY